MAGEGGAFYSRLRIALGFHMSDTNSCVLDCVNDLLRAAETPTHLHPCAGEENVGKSEDLSSWCAHVCLGGVTSAGERLGFPVKK